MDNNKIVTIIHTLSLIGALCGVVLFLFGVFCGWMVLGISALLLFLVRLFMRAKTTNKLLMRHLSILMFGAGFLLGGAYLMSEGKSYWVIPLVIDAVIECYISFRLGAKR